MQINQLSHFLKLGAVCVSVFGLAACAKLEDRARGYLASSVDVFAVVDGQLLLGEADLYDNRTATLTMRTGLAVTPALSCSGRLTRTGTTSAALEMHCNTGLTLALSAAMLAETQGYAYGQSSSGQLASLTLGLESARAVSYLRAPAGQQLVALPKKPYIELR